MSGIFSNIQLATNCTADEIQSIGAEYLNNERQRQDNPLLTWAQLVAQTKAKKKHNAELCVGWGHGDDKVHILTSNYDDRIPPPSPTLLQPSPNYSPRAAILQL